MRRLARLALAAAALAGADAPTRATAAELVVGVEAIDYFPEYRSGGKDQYDGFARDLLDAFAAANGHKLSTHG